MRKHQTNQNFGRFEEHSSKYMASTLQTVKVIKDKERLKETSPTSEE
jgi:hypothetical protein